MNKNNRKLIAEGLGTAWLVLGGCGSAVIAASFPEVGIGLHGVALAFGLTVLTMAYAIGPISGCHLNPAVTIGLYFANKHPKNEVVPYVLAQIIGAIIGAGILYLMASGKVGFELGNFAANGYGDHSPGNYNLLSAIVTETVATAFFLLVILGATDKLAPSGFAPIAIGLCLTLIHLFTIPVTNTSVNPARSIGTALFVGGWAIGQLWVFILSPVLGGIIGAIFYKFLYSERSVLEGQKEPIQKTIHPTGNRARI